MEWVDILIVSGIPLPIPGSQPAGKQGPQGPSGSPGHAGVTGQNGQAGRKGRSGQSGQPGTAGRPGNRGSDGTVVMVGPTKGTLRISCDLRIVRVSDASAVLHASGAAGVESMGTLAKELASKLSGDPSYANQPVAVVSLRNRSASPLGRAISEELADKVSGFLIEAQLFDVKERIELRSVLNEQDLEDARIVKQPRVRDQLAGIEYIVVGGVTVIESK